MKRKARKRREQGVIWIARDSESCGDEGNDVHFHGKKPQIEQEGGNCSHCGKTTEIAYYAGEGSLCYAGFEKLTGIKITPGSLTKIKVQVIE